MSRYRMVDGHRVPAEAGYAETKTEIHPRQVYWHGDVPATCGPGAGAPSARPAGGGRASDHHREAGPAAAGVPGGPGTSC